MKKLLKDSQATLFDSFHMGGLTVFRGLAKVDVGLMYLLKASEL